MKRRSMNLGNQVTRPRSLRGFAAPARTALGRPRFDVILCPRARPLVWAYSILPLAFAAAIVCHCMLLEHRRRRASTG